MVAPIRGSKIYSVYRKKDTYGNLRSTAETAILLLTEQPGVFEKFGYFVYSYSVLRRADAHTAPSFTGAFLVSHQFAAGYIAYC